MFSGFHCLLINAGIGARRATIINSNIRKEKGEVVSEFGQDSKHPVVLVEDSLTQAKVSDLVGRKLRNFSSVGPRTVHIVKVSWVTESILNGSLEPVSRYELFCRHFGGDNTDEKCSENAAFPKKVKHLENLEKNQSSETNITSDISSTAKNLNDNEFEPDASSVKKENFICSNVYGSSAINHNREVTDELQKLAEAYRNNSKEQWRAVAYDKAISVLKNHPKKISSYEDAVALRGIGDGLAKKIQEIVESGACQKAQEICSGEKAEALKILNGIWGVGPTTAEKWYQMGIRTLEDVRQKVKLNAQQQVGLDLYDDLVERMPRKEASEILERVRLAVLELAEGKQVSVKGCGSFRRGKETCGDVDVLVSFPEDEEEEDSRHLNWVHTSLISRLHREAFLTHDLTLDVEEKRQKKYMGVCRLSPSHRHRRIDIISCPWSEHAPALLYFTGSAHFNRSMRQLAVEKGMYLSQHCLREGTVRVAGEIVDEGRLIQTPTEQSIFEKLGLQYRLPEERNA